MQCFCFLFVLVLCVKAALVAFGADDAPLHADPQRDFSDHLTLAALFLAYGLLSAFKVRVTRRAMRFLKAETSGTTCFW